MSKHGMQKIDEVIDKIGNLFIENEENRKPIIQQFGKIEKLLQEKYADNPKVMEYIEDALSRSAGGIYIPYILWKYVFAFINSKDKEEIQEARQKIQKYLDIFFGESYFDEEEQRLIRPLLALYLKYETNFEIDKFFNKTRMQGYHDSVVKYIRKTRKFIEDNMRTLAIYKKKLRYVKALNGDYSLFELPVSELEQKIKQQK